jgi:Zn-dependent protease with chaperone function
MNLFERQEAVRRRSRRLVLLFALAVAGIVFAVNAVAVVLLVVLPGRPEAAPGVVLTATTLTLLVMGGASLYRSLGLRRGGAAVAASLGGTAVPPDTQDPNLRRLRNVVEEMAIAAGAPMPQVFVLENEVGINAFAAGFSPADAAVAVTRGALDRLNRSELQAVVAHEFGHIVNGDIRLNLRLVGWLFGILVLGLVGRQVLRASDGRDRNAVPVVMLALFLMLVGWVGLWFARLIKAGISRQREYLADASAVQFTRDPDGLVGAFCKIGGAPAGGHLEIAEAEEVSHMLFEDGIGFSGWMATHPPLLDRIRAIRPGFRPAQWNEVLARRQLPPPIGLDEDHALGLAGPPPLPPEDAELRIAANALAAGVGEWRPGDVERARAITAAIPDTLDRAARDREEAVLLLYGLLLSAQPAVRERQCFELRARTGEAVVGQAGDYAERLIGLHASLRLPLAMLALATVKRRPRAELQAIADVCFALSHADGRVGFLSYGLAQLLRNELAESAEPTAHWHRPRLKLAEVEAEAVTLLTVMAHAGHAAPAEAQRAFMAGLQHLFPQSGARYQPPSGGLAVLDEAWPRLDALLPKAKLMLVEALTAAALHDGRLSVAEGELLRIACAVLHAPLPAALCPGRAD